MARGAFVRLAWGVLPALVLSVVSPVARADQDAKQVEIEVRFVEATRDAARELGVEFGFSADAPKVGLVPPASTVPVQAATAGAAIEAVIRTLDPTQARVLAKPAIVVPSGEEAVLTVGEAFRIPGATGEEGAFEFELAIEPRVQQGTIVLELAPELIDVDVSTGVARLSRRELETQVRVPQGDTVVIGGLLQPDAHEAAARIPLLGDVPILGTLFRSERFQQRETELLILITPMLQGGLGGGGRAATASTPPAKLPPVPAVDMDFDFSGFWQKDAERPGFPLVTTKQLVLIDNPLTGQPFFGELSGPDTEIEYDEDSEGLGFGAGFSGDLGGWFGQDRRHGVEIGGFWAPELSASDGFHSPQQQDFFFSVPYFNAAEGFEHAILVGSSVPGNQSPTMGTVDLSSDRSFHGVGARYQHRLWDEERWRLSASAGVRWIHVGESFSIDYRSEPSGQNLFSNANLGSYLFPMQNVFQQGAVVSAQDRVTACNDFVGLDLGVDWELALDPRLLLKVSPSVALGGNMQELDTSGWGRAVDANGNAWNTPYGVFARPGGVGSRSDTAFAVVPEIDIELAVRVTDNLQVLVGYGFLYLNDVVYAGNQLDRRIDVPVGPGNQFLASPQAVSRPFETDDFWAQSFRVGVELKF